MMMWIFIVVNVVRAVPSRGTSSPPAPALADCDSSDDNAEDEEDVPSVVLLFVVTGRICVTKLVLFVELHWCVSP
jgi:hypothetical protein